MRLSSSTSAPVSLGSRCARPAPVTLVAAPKRHPLHVIPKRTLVSSISSLHGAHPQSQPHMARGDTEDHPKHKHSSFQFGHIFRVHSEEEVKKMAHHYKDRTVVLMCKATHCKPCKIFQHTYVTYAQRFEDSVFLEIVGDENPDTRALMAQWKVKVTPTFRLYRNGEYVQTLTGVNKAKLRDAILSGLAENHKGRDWVEPEVAIDSFDSMDD